VSLIQAARAIQGKWQTERQTDKTTERKQTRLCTTNRAHKHTNNLRDVRERRQTSDRQASDKSIANASAVRRGA